MTQRGKLTGATMVPPNVPAVSLVETSNRESRLRSRIDFITDERDAALEELWALRTDLEDLERRFSNTRRALNEARRSRDMWRQRAQDAETMLNRRQKKAKATA